MPETNEGLSTDKVVVDSRIRKDMGNLDELADSIKNVGLIHPIVLTRELKLVAGERRLRAMQKLGINVLVHARTFIYNDEVDELKLKAMEIEENVKRQNFTWQEDIIAKKRLLEILQQIHGVARAGYPSRSDQLGITSPGFGVNKLAALLGTSNASISRDLELADIITAVPQLAKAETKEAARRQASLALNVAGALQLQAKNPLKTDQKWTLYEGDFRANADNIESSSIDLVLCDPPYGEGASGMGPQSKPLVAQPFADGFTETRDLYYQLASSAWRVLRGDRFSAWFFGFALYSDLVRALQDCGFLVDLTPLVWVKNTVINTNPYTRYGRSYEPILLARKGEPKLYRPMQRDVIQIQNIITRGSNANDPKVYNAQKPVDLMAKLVLDLSPPGGNIVDFCAGSGSTGVAALQNGRRVVLFEKDFAACQIIRSRLGVL